MRGNTLCPCGDSDIIVAQEKPVTQCDAMTSSFVIPRKHARLSEWQTARLRIVDVKNILENGSVWIYSHVTQSLGCDIVQRGPVSRETWWDVSPVDTHFVTVAPGGAERCCRATARLKQIVHTTPRAHKPVRAARGGHQRPEWKAVSLLLSSFDVTCHSFGQTHGDFYTSYK